MTKITKFITGSPSLFTHMRVSRQSHRLLHSYTSSFWYHILVLFSSPFTTYISTVNRQNIYKELFSSSNLILY